MPHGEAESTPRRLFVSRERLSPLLKQAAAAGVDIDALLDELGLRASLSDGISLGDYYRIQNRLAVIVRDETLHLSSRQLLPGSTDFVLQHARDSRSLRDVMKVIARTYNLLHGGEYNAVEARANSIDYVVDDTDFPYASDISEDYLFFSIECILIMLHGMLLAASPDLSNEALLSVHIRRPLGDVSSGHLAYWDTPIKFGAARYRLSIDRGAAEAPIAPDPKSLNAAGVFAMIEKTVAMREAGGGALRRISSAVRDALNDGVIDQQSIAARLGHSVATLRRRLGAENTSFRELKRLVLNEKAQRLLSTGRSVEDVSEALGFSEYRSFNRAFR